MSACGPPPDRRDVQRDDFVVRSFPSIASLGTGREAGRLRTAIVTEEILGPVRNGGIASTYHHLAKGLAAHGHEVHVLLLKGRVVQDETPEHWVQAYADVGVSLHYLEESSATPWAAADRWQRRYAAAYDWLRDQAPFDVVHTSEWRGGLHYVLMAKRLGLAFRDTLFVVKTSSPYIWNRHYQMQPITQVDLVAASYAEQTCVELADVVVGGSAHLLSFMDRIGYRLPDTNVYVQPNVVDFARVAVHDQRPGPARQPGDVIGSRDLAFFGRLEERKGLELFCNAIDLLHERGEVPDSVLFLGKWGANLPAQGGVAAQDYLRDKTQRWSCPVSVVTDRNQPEALSLLCERDVISVMPSLIENSSMAVYEALAQRIPFIATAVGGTPELVDEADHADCLVEPTAHALADRLGHALRLGQPIAHPRFSNDDNLAIWYGFHARVAELIQERGRTRAVADLSAGADRPGEAIRTISFVGLVRRDESLDDLVKALHEDPPDRVVLGFTDTAVRPEVERARAALAPWCGVDVVSCVGQAAGEALNTLVAHQTADAVVVSHGAGVAPLDGFFTAARTALSHRPGTLFTSFFLSDAEVGMPLGGDVASQFLTSRSYGPETVTMATRTFDELGGFEPYDAHRGLVHELVTRACQAGRDLLVLPEPLLSWPAASEESAAFATDPHYSYLKAKAVIDAADLAPRKVLLAALYQQGLHQQGRRREVDPEREGRPSAPALPRQAPAPPEAATALAASRELLRQPPETGPVLISPRSGLKPPDDREGWCVGDWLTGWAWDREDRQRTLHVAVVRGGQPLAMTVAGVADPSLDDVPGRGRHGFQLLVQPEFFDGDDELRLEIWEGRVPVFRASLVVDRSAGPMLRRRRDTPPLDVALSAPDAGSAPVSRWWRRRPG